MNKDQTVVVRNAALQMLQALKDAADRQDTGLLTSFGFNESECEDVMRLASVPGGELERLVDQQGSFLNVTINIDKLSRILKSVSSAQERQKLLVDLVRADAPNQLFYDCYGYSSDMACELRNTVLGSDRRRFTRRALKEDEVNRLYTAKSKFEKAHAAGDEDNLVSAVVSLCLALHYETDIPIRRFYHEIVGA